MKYVGKDGGWHVVENGGRRYVISRTAPWWLEDDKAIGDGYTRVYRYSHDLSERKRHPKHWLTDAEVGKRFRKRVIVAAWPMIDE